METKTNKKVVRRKPVKRRSKSLAPKIISVLAAIVLWFYVMSAEAPNFKQNFNGVSVDLYGIDKIENTYGLSAILGSDQIIDVELSGKKNIVTSIKSSDVYAYVDISQITNAGRYTLPVQISTPSGVTVASFHPETISVHLDRLTTKEVQVQAVKSSVKLEKGLSIGDVTFNKEYVSVTGPAEFVDSVSKAQIKLDLSNMKSSIDNYTDTVVLVDASGNEISNQFTKIVPSSVTASVPLIITKDVALTVDFTHQYFNSDNSEIKIAPATISVSMPVEMSSEISSIPLMSIDETQIISDTLLQSQIILPKGVTNNSDTLSATVDIKLKNLEKSVFTVEKNKINIQNIPNGYTAEIQTKTVSFAVRGPVGTVSKMNASDFKVSLDLTGHNTEGTSSVPLTVKAPSNGVYVLSGEGEYSLPTVMVTLKKKK